MRRLFVLAVIPFIAACQPGPHGPVGRGETLITISATGEAKARADQASFSAGLTSYGATANAASAANAEAMQKIIAALEAAGIKPDDLRTEAVNVGESWNGKGNRKYEASNSVSVLVRKVDQAGKLIATATSAGATSVSSLQTGLSDPALAERNAIAAAWKTARAKADAHASALGLRVLRVVKASDGSSPTDGVVYPMEAPAVAADSASEPPIRVGVETTRASLVAEFALVK